MKKHIRKIGTQLGITFTSPELEIYGIEEGDVVDLSDMHVVGKGLPGPMLEDLE